MFQGTVAGEYGNVQRNRVPGQETSGEAHEGDAFCRDEYDTWGKSRKIWKKYLKIQCQYVHEAYFEISTPLDKNSSRSQNKNNICARLK